MTPSGPSPKRLIVIETGAQAQWIAQRAGGLRPSEVLLAITPEAAYACQELNQPYIKVEDFTAPAASRLEQYKSDLMPRYQAWSNWLDQQCQQLLPAFSQAGFRAAQAADFLLQTLLIELWAATQNARELLAALRPQAVAMWPPEVRGVPWYLHPNVAALPALLPPAAQRQNLAVENLAYQAPALAPVSLASAGGSGLRHLARWLRHQARETRLIAQWRTIAGSWAFSSQRWLPPAPWVLISGYFFDMPHIAAALRRRGVYVWQLPDTLPIPRLWKLRPPLPATFYADLAAAGEKLLALPQLAEPLTWFEMETTPLWSKPMEFWWHYLVPEFWARYQQVQRQLKQKSYCAVVTWESGGGSLCDAAAQAANHAHCPVYLYQHGGTIGISHPTWQTHLKPEHTCLVYGNGTIEEIQHTALPLFQPDHVVAVGSAYHDDVRRQHRPHASSKLRTQLQGEDARPLILYIPTHFNGYGRTAGDLAAYPDVSYFELQQKILQLWLEAPGVRLLYKDFVVAQDRSRIMAQFIQKHIPGAIVTTQRLTKLMWAADAIIIDHTLTALAEVLSTNKPVIAYLPSPTLATTNARDLLAKRATVAETPAAFEAAVRALLQAGTYSDVKDPNTEFLQAYGTHLDDGRSAERAADIILGSALEAKR